MIKIISRLRSTSTTSRHSEPKKATCKNARNDGIVKKVQEAHPEGRSLQVEGPYFYTPNEFELTILTWSEERLATYNKDSMPKTAEEKDCQFWKALLTDTNVMAQSESPLQKEQNHSTWTLGPLRRNGARWRNTQRHVHMYFTISILNNMWWYWVNRSLAVCQKGQRKLEESEKMSRDASKKLRLHNSVPRNVLRIYETAFLNRVLSPYPDLVLRRQGQCRFNMKPLHSGTMAKW